MPVTGPVPFFSISSDTDVLHFLQQCIFNVANCGGLINVPPRLRYLNTRSLGGGWALFREVGKPCWKKHLPGVVFNSSKSSLPSSHLALNLCLQMGSLSFLLRWPATTQPSAS